MESDTKPGLDIGEQGLLVKEQGEPGALSQVSRGSVTTDEVASLL
jgi:hypothetical protein